RHLKLGILYSLVYSLILHLALSLFLCCLLKPLSYVSSVLIHCIELAYLACEVIVRLGKLAYLYLVYLYLEERILPLEILCMILLRELNVYVNKIVSVCTDELILKTGDKCV